MRVASRGVAQYFQRALRVVLDGGGVGNCGYFVRGVGCRAVYFEGYSSRGFCHGERRVFGGVVVAARVGGVVFPPVQPGGNGVEFEEAHVAVGCWRVIGAVKVDNCCLDCDVVCPRGVQPCYRAVAVRCGLLAGVVRVPRGFEFDEVDLYYCSCCGVVLGFVEPGGECNARGVVLPP